MKDHPLLTMTLSLSLEETDGLFLVELRQLAERGKLDTITIEDVKHAFYDIGGGKYQSQIPSRSKLCRIYSSVLISST
jgi:hypothetical protein